MTLFKKEVSADEMKRLSEEDLEGVDGGYRYTHYWASDPCMVFEVIDDTTGDVLATFYDEKSAWDYCRNNGVNTKSISQYQLDSLRKYGHI